MNVSMAIVCRNELANISRCLESLRGQRLPVGEYELVVVDNGSTDGTRELLEKASPGFPVPLRVIDNPTPGIAASRNVAIGEARYEKVLFIDADCIAPPNWLRRYVEDWADEVDGQRIAAAGGGNIAPAGGNTFQRSLGIMLNSVLGSRGSTQGILYTQRRVIDHHPCLNLMLDRQIVLEAGGFDEEHCQFMGEDQDLSFRLNARGFKYLFVPGCPVEHQLRPDWRKWGRNMYAYGIGRVRLMRRYPHARNWLFHGIRLGAPGCILSVLLAMVLLVLGRPGWAWMLLPIATYAGVIAVYSLWLCAQAGALRYTPHVVRNFFVTHFCYSLGMNHPALLR